MPASLDVLIVDDEPKICQLLEQLLAARGCTVRVAADGLDALTQFQRRHADMVITDLRMPKLSGMELLRELKRLDPLLNIVVITAYPSVENAVEAMQYGACDFLTKPFDITQIQAILYRCQQRVSLSRQLRSSGEGLLKLEELNRRLAELNDLKSQFLAALSHEINTPLCLMSEWIYLLSEGKLGDLTGDQQHAVEVLIGAYGRLQRLLQQLVDLMRGADVVLRRQRLDLRRLVTQAVETLKAKAASRSIAVLVQLPEQELWLEVDPVRCTTAFEHLLDNAVKFNRNGGQIVVEMNEDVETIHLRIRDTGIGIPADELPKIFTPFYQANRGPGRVYEGSGIGLTLAKRYVELHGGSLALVSDEHSGTTVTIALPRPSAAATLPRVQTFPF